MPVDQLILTGFHNLFLVADICKTSFSFTESAAFVSEAELFLDSGTGPETHKSLVLGRALHDFVGEADNELTFKACTISVYFFCFNA